MEFLIKLLCHLKDLGERRGREEGELERKYLKKQEREERVREKEREIVGRKFRQKENIQKSEGVETREEGGKRKRDI